jgi:predicted TIM-barrel fold metal-dependent hydrolase
MLKSASGRIHKQLDYLTANTGKLTIDADTHLTDIQNMHPMFRERMKESHDYYQGKPIDAQDLLKEMKMAGVDMSLVWQNPAATLYPGNKDENFTSLLAANRYIYDSAVNHPDKFIPAGWTDPKALGFENALKLAEICVKEFGFAIVKMNPAQNEFPIDDEVVAEMVKHITGMKAIPAFHYGADTIYTPAKGLENLAARFPQSPILAIHMGGGGAGYHEAEQMYHESRELGLKFPNIRYVLSARRDTHSENDIITYQMAGEPFKHNICCASDAPYGRQTWNFGGYRCMLETMLDGQHHTDPRLQKNPQLFKPEDISNFLGGNFARLVAGVYREMV